MTPPRPCRSAKASFSKIEHDKFKYLGCKIEKQRNGDISLNQTEYIQNIEEVEFPAKRNSCPVNEKERKEIRRVVGELLWVSLKLFSPGDVFQCLILL